MGDAPEHFSLVDVSTQQEVMTGKLTSNGPVNNWSGRTFWTADFSSWRQPGHYEIQVPSHTGEVHSCSFEVGDNLLERSTLSNVIFYFKGQRSSGLIDLADRHLRLPATKAEYIDVHGGWYDATGDYGIHLSHQNLTSYFNPQ